MDGGGVATPGRRGVFPALMVADFVSTTGSEISALAVPWFVLTTTGSAARTGVALAAEFIGLVAFGVPAGEFVTRLGARRATVVSDGVRAILVALVPVLYAAHALSFGLLLALLFAIGAFFPAHSAAADLMLAAVVGQDRVRLTRASGILGSVNEAGSLMGPALGGALIALTSPTAALYVDAATYLVAAALVMVFVRAGRVVHVEGEASDSGGVLDGIRFLVADRWLRITSIGVAVMELAWTGMTAALPVLAFRGYDGNVRLAGLFLASYGGGAVIGGLQSGRAVKRFGIGRVALTSYAGAAAGMWILATSPPAWGVITAVGVVGVFTGVFMPALFTEITLRTPVALRAKVLASANVVFSVTGPIGFIGVGLLLQHVTGTGPAFVAIAVAATLAVAIFSAAGSPQAVAETRGASDA